DNFINKELPQSCRNRSDTSMGHFGRRQDQGQGFWRFDIHIHHGTSGLRRREQPLMADPDGGRDQPFLVKKVVRASFAERLDELIHRRSNPWTSDMPLAPFYAIWSQTQQKLKLATGSYVRSGLYLSSASPIAPC